MVTTHTAVKKVQNDKQASLSDKEMMLALRQSMNDQRKLVLRIDRWLNAGSPRKALPHMQALERMGIRHSVASRFYAIALGQIFMYYKERWDQLPQRFLQAHPGGYYAYIQETFDYSDQMCDMYSTVWEAFFSGKYLKPGDIPPYVHLSKIGIAKLRVAASYIIAGQMTSWRWKILANGELERKEVVHMMARGTSKTKRLGRPPSIDQLVVHRDTGDFRLYTKDTIEELGHLNINSPNPRVVEQVRRVIKALKIKVRR